MVGERQHDRQTICRHARLSEQRVLPFQNDHADRQRRGHRHVCFSLLQIIPLSPFSYADEAAQWSNNELIQLQVDGNKPIINQAHIDEYRGLSGLLINPKLPSGRTNVARAHTVHHHAGRCTNFFDTS